MENKSSVGITQEKPAAPPPEESGNTPKKKKIHKKTLWKRILLCLGSFLLYVLVVAVVACQLLLNGPSITMRNALVLSAKQASATKWLPGLFLSEETIAQIEKDSLTIKYDVVSMDALSPSVENEKDEWAEAKDGILLKIVKKSTFKGYLLMIRDPSRVYVGTSSDYRSGKEGARIFDIVEREGAVCAINGGEFPDEGGVGNGATPIGITYSRGELVFSGHTNRTFMGFTDENKLVVSEGMTKARAEELGIRDGVCFQTGNSLITNDGKNVTLHYADGNTGRSQRTAIGQRADGTVLMLVTDGRTASSLGATHNELIDVMLENGAVAAGKLDGGSSAMMYYRNYFELYGYNYDKLDEFQRQGMVNSYKAFTDPRKLPTYFLVGEAK